MIQIKANTGQRH